MALILLNLTNTFAVPILYSNRLNEKVINKNVNAISIIVIIK